MAVDRAARQFLVAIGMVDLVAGAVMVALPLWVRQLLGGHDWTADAVAFVRFVGVFVAALGGCYLLAAREVQPESVRAALRLTLPFRLGAGLYCAIAVASGSVPLLWSLVVVADALIIVGQLALLRQKQIR